MTIGDVIRLEFATASDPDTGVEVTRLTDDRGDTSSPYFTQPLFSDDGSGLLVSSNRTGTWQAYFVELDRRRMVQLSDEPEGIRWTASAMLPSRSQVVFVAGRALKRVGLDGSDLTTLYEAPPGFTLSVLSPTADGSSVVFAYIEEVALSTAAGHLVAQRMERFCRRPTSVVMRVDTGSGFATALWGERNLITHVNVSPVAPDIIVFCHEGPWHLVQRTWVLRASTGEVWPIILQRRACERAGHEFFTRSGRVVTEYAWRFHPNARDWINLDVFVWPDGRDHQAFRYLWDSPGPVGHNQVSWHDETLGVGDAAFPEKDFPHGRDYIGLIRYQEELARPIPLCRHDCTRQAVLGHPFPVFSPDDRCVYFNSDRAGRCDVYRVPVPTSF